MIALSAILALTISTSAAGSYFYIKDITMHLEDGNATFELNYSLDSFTNLYVMALGCKYIEHDLLSLLGNYSQIKIVGAGPQRASLLAIGAGKYNSGYYLYDSKPLGSRQKALQEKVPQFTVIYPGGRSRTFYNVTSTQNVFCEAKALKTTSNMSMKSNNTLSHLKN
jgi:hypothetical protein